MLAADKRQYVQRMFSEIAPRYDLLNHLLSFNVDRSWRRRAIAALAWERAPGGIYVDLCAGTLDVSLALATQPRFAGHVLGADFAEPMLRAGSSKSATASGSISPVVGDALQLPLRDASAEGAIVAFGIRNVADLDAALVETFRILKPGARFVILEFSTPESPVIRAGYHAYFHHVLPTIGGVISGHGSAYRYLPDSVAHFPNGEDLAERMRSTGFTDVTWQSLTFGVAALHVGQRP
ncbi:MAG TPA: bifunctional demethylmenaquinone methyltransferase/2-methoxy-6-polyprenyl-1,4-benzoquinol methylase UbiE [Gemmatimonadaceae bacterium]|nr:bifunctional demethylmenaquinone methyltransferase/2-methoxy-6-polyprenyl-1,4-benzoquinol methylase UbiE [Gemmatimonadaceae bacterium]